MEAAQTAVPAPPVRRLRATRGFVPIDFEELWAYRSLLYLFMWRDLKTRYRQTFLSGFWAIFRPFSQMVLFSAIFGGIAHIKPGDDLPYPLFVYPAVIVWTYFSSALLGSSTSLGAAGGLMTKAYFPRLYAPLASVTAPLIDLVLSLVIVAGLFAWYQRLPSWHVIFLPIPVLLGMFVGLGIGLWVTGPAVKYRDIGFTIPFLAQLWMYASPVIYPVTLVPDRYRWLLDLNPMTAVIEGVRWSILGSAFPAAGAVAGALGFVAVALTSGLFLFRRSERTVVDLM
jgi:lipopolysaccharide transport system permease protein